jgi:hypothetical protein
MEHIDYLRQLITDMATDIDGDIAVGENFTFVYEGHKFAGRIYDSRAPSRSSSTA